MKYAAETNDIIMITVNIKFSNSSFVNCVITTSHHLQKYRLPKLRKSGQLMHNLSIDH